MGRHRQRSSWGAGVIVGGALIAAVATAQPVLAAGFDDRDCRDLATQSEAQAFFLAGGEGDPHDLDRDDDNIACEDLPAGAGEAQPAGGTDEDFVLPDADPELQERFTPGRDVAEPK